VIVRDWRRYDGEFGGMKPLDVLEVHQRCGGARARPRSVREAVLLANDADTKEELFERYLWADPEPVRSKLAAEPALRTHVLATVASGFASTRDGLLSFLDNTLYATQTDDEGRLAAVTDTVLDYLAVNDFIERDRDGGSESLTATGIGHTVSRLYLDPMSAAEMIDGLRSVARDAADTGASAEADNGEFVRTGDADDASGGDEPGFRGTYTRAGDDESGARGKRRTRRRTKRRRRRPKSPRSASITSSAALPICTSST